MSNGNLFISFWHICLDNLPEGAFRRNRITHEDAKFAIDQAQAKNKLLCLSDDDLLAPYCKRERDDHDALCRVLNEYFGIKLSLRDFCSGDGDDNDPRYGITPLNCVQIQGQDRLLVVTCAYSVAEKKSGDFPTFEINPKTVEFHIIEAGDAIQIGTAQVPAIADWSKPQDPETEQKELEEFQEALIIDIFDRLETDESEAR